MTESNPVAIIGMGCLFPKSTDLTNYWQLLYHGKDAITDVPESHWSPSDYFDNDPKSPDRVYCKRGGFLSPVSFDPSEFGIPPSSLEATDTSQLLGLYAAKMALDDCGYGRDRDFDRDRTSVILGVTGTQELVIPLSSRLGHPKWRKALKESAVPVDKAEEVIKKISDSYVPWQENSFPGLLGNVVAGRICNRLDLRGTNCVVDAACASSLSAIHLSILELQSGRSDMVVTGGVDTLNDIFMHMCFSKTHTLSASGDARPFSEDADGTVLGEGIGILVLKRLKEAKKDGDRIYAVIKGLGSSSDGKSQSIYAPGVDGQAKALRSAYKNAGINPATIGLIEAHGTGTRVGDKVEFEALNQVFGEFGANGHKCALGSVKSMIGHTKASAGAAGLIKAALGLYHKVLPPTLKAETPDPSLDISNSHFYLNTSTRPWISENGHPRRAGVSAFGFGGSNFHVVLEEYRADKAEISWDGSVEIFAFSAGRQDELIRRVKRYRDFIESGLSNREYGIKAAESRTNFSSGHSHRLLIVDEYDSEKSDLFNSALSALDSGARHRDLKLKNIYIGGPQKPGKLAFAFPGQGSQYLGMGRDYVCMFPQAMQVLEDANKKLNGPINFSNFIFPPIINSLQDRRRQEAALRKTDIAQPAIGTISLAMLKVVREFGINPDATCGHSFGELTALCAAGWIAEEALLELAITRGRLMAAAGGNQDPPDGAMLAVQAPLDELQELIGNTSPKIVLANRNSPSQGVLSGPTPDIIEIQNLCKKKKINTIRLPVSAAFHSEQVKEAALPFQNALQEVSIKPTAIEVFSNTTGRSYPADDSEARFLLGNHLTRPVEFIKEIESLYSSGVRTFVEIGPKSVLTGLVSVILQDSYFEAMALDASAGQTSGVADLARMLSRLAALGYPVALSKWEKPTSTVRKSRMNVLLSGTNYKSQKSQNRGQMTEVRRQKTEDRNQKTEIYEFGMRNAECGIIQDRGQKVKDSNRKPLAINDQTNLNKVQKADSIGQAPEIVSPQQSKPSHRTYEHKNPMNRNKNKNQDVIADALKVVQEGLKSMQHLQSQTAMAHQKFLEAQTEANRSLKEMMKNAQRLTERSLGIDAEPGQPPPTPQYRLEPPPEPELPKNDITPTINHHSSHPATAATPRDSDEIPSQPVAHKLTEGAANGYSQDDHDHDLQIEKTNQSPQAFEEIVSTMLEVVSQLTGYPEEMLGLDMDIEAELGIDSIKRVEILSTLEEKMPDLPAVSPEIMGSLKTLGQIAEFLSVTAEGKKAENHSKMSVGIEKNTFVEKTPSADENLPPEITSMMLEVVSQLTGYPEEMLGLDMDIEAELGIDSIKRVEILSILEEKMPDLPAVSPEIMGTLKTLGQIADYLTKPTTPEIPRESIDEGTLTVSAAPYGGQELSDNTPQRLPDPNPPDISRNVVTVVDAPAISETPIKIAESKKVLVTEDNTGLAGEIARELEKVGISSVRISLDNLRSKKRLPDAAGLVIVQDPGSPKMAQDLKDAFTLTKHMAANLINSASGGGALFATVTRLDGAFGFKQTKAGNPLQGGLAGLVKTAAIEWQDVCCHAIDIAPDWSDHRKIAEAVVREIMIPGPVEIGLDARYRCVLALEPRPFPAGRINLEKGDVIVISGGARGITAAAALELANHDKLKLVLLGRSPNPVDEPDWLSAIEGDAAIKKAILKNEYKNQPATPVEIEKAFKRYMANREIAENLAELKSTGSDAVYYSVDVRNSEDVQATMDDIRLNHGPIAGIIHGAGVLEDRLIIDKTLNQFERVFDTKVMGLDNLLHATRNNPLKYLVIFSSIAARMGNKGQVDYAMANEALNKIALAESLHRPECRVVAINWGPWDGGMVTSALKGEFERNGIDLIPTHDGAKCMVYEMMADKDDPVEVVIGAEMTSLNLNVRSELQRPALVKTSPVTKKQQLSLSFERQIDTQRYPVLESHTIDGRPVVPLALITEWLAHGALHENPGLVLHGMDEIRILKGIRLGPDKKLVRMLAGKLKKSGDFYEVDLELRGGKKAGRDILHSRAKAILSDRLNASPDYQFSKAMVAKAYPRNVEDVYEKILFHGAQLHGIRKIVSCSSRGMVAHISPAPEPGEWISDPLRNQWIADPLVLDSAFQMATVWCHEEKGIVSLPSYVASYRQYCHQFPTDRVTVVLEVKDATNRKMKGDFTILDADDEIVACVTGYETIMDSSLSKAFKPQYRASA